MPIEKTPNYIRIRVADSKRFIRFRVKILGKGIKAVIGFPKKGGSQIQSYLFSRSKWTIKTAKAWIKKHGHTVQETYWVTDVIINPETLELILEETIAEPEDEFDVKNITKEDITWLME